VRDPPANEEKYDADEVRRLLVRAGAAPVIPGRYNGNRIICYDKDRYCDGHEVETDLCHLANKSDPICKATTAM